MSWGWYRVVSPTTTMQRSRRWIPVPMWLQHTRRLGKSWRIKINHETVICMLGLVLPSLDTTTSQEISSDRKRGEMNSNHIYHTLLRKMRWGKCQLVSPTTTIQMLRRWIPVPTWLQHTRRLGRSWRNLWLLIKLDNYVTSLVLNIAGHTDVYSYPLNLSSNSCMCKIVYTLSQQLTKRKNIERNTAGC